MKVSFDFDGCLSEDYIQQIAKSLVDSGHDVWVITGRVSRYNIGIELDHMDIVRICNEIGIDIKKIVVTEGAMKEDDYFKGNFDLHFDDDWEEVLLINKRGGHAILINPDYETIYREMQYKTNEN